MESPGIIHVGRSSSLTPLPPPLVPLPTACCQLQPVPRKALWMVGEDPLLPASVHATQTFSRDLGKAEAGQERSEDAVLSVWKMLPCYTLWGFPELSVE